MQAYFTGAFKCSIHDARHGSNINRKVRIDITKQNQVEQFSSDIKTEVGKFDERLKNVVGR